MLKKVFCHYMKNKRIIIGFDANPAAQQNLTGIGAYTQRLMYALAKENENIEFVGYYFDFLGKKNPKNLPQAKNISYKRVILYPGKIVNLLRRLGIDLPVELFLKTKCDYLLFPNYLSSPSLFKSKTIPVVHDLTHLYYPEFMSDKNQNDLKRFLPKTLSRSSSLITVSESTKKDVIKEYGYEKPILVTPIPYKKNTNVEIINKPELIKKYGCKENYILFVGTLEPRKNIIKLLEAFEQSDWLNKDFSLVLCGGTDWKFEEVVKKIEKLKQKGLSIVHTGFVEARMRDSLYAHCSVFVSPSHYEGFGMPLLEALSYNRPLAVSDIPIFHEVAENSAIYFDQNSSGSIAEGIHKALTVKTSSKPTYLKLNWEIIAKGFFEFINNKILRSK